MSTYYSSLSFLTRLMLTEAAQHSARSLPRPPSLSRLPSRALLLPTRLPPRSRSQSSLLIRMAYYRFPATIASVRSSPLPRFAHHRVRLQKPSISNTKLFSSIASSAKFGWDDVLRVAEADQEDDDPSDLRRYFEKVRVCNRGSEMQSEFLPFVVDDQIGGYIHKRFVEYLRKFQDVFTIVSSNNGCYIGGHITLHSSLNMPEDRTRAVGHVITCLGKLIPGIRNELYPVTSSFGMPIFFCIERAAAPFFGTKAYGVHMNGYVERDGQKFLWIGKRSDTKHTFPGMLDHLVAGGLPHGIACKENLIKECEEEAGIPRSISNNAVSVGAVSYVDIDEYSCKRDVLFCYDLKLPAEFVPENKDGELEGFRLVPVTHVANIIRRTNFFKPNCSIVIIDFLFRHGYISPDDHGFLNLLQSLRSGDCS